MTTFEAAAAAAAERVASAADRSNVTRNYIIESVFGRDAVTSFSRSVESSVNMLDAAPKSAERVASAADRSNVTRNYIITSVFGRDAVTSFSRSLESSANMLNAAAPRTSASFMGETKPQRPHKKWEESVQDLRAYSKKHGHCNASRYKQGSEKKLAIFVKKQRQEYKRYKVGQKSCLTEERIKELESIGFNWDGRDGYDVTWRAMFLELKRYYEEYRRRGDSNNTGVSPPPAVDGAKYPRLKNWVDKQRRLFKRRVRGEESCLTDERIAQLRSIGFLFDGRAGRKKKGNGTKPSDTDAWHCHACLRMNQQTSKRCSGCKTWRGGMMKRKNRSQMQEPHAVAWQCHQCNRYNHTSPPCAGCMAWRGGKGKASRELQSDIRWRTTAAASMSQVGAKDVGREALTAALLMRDSDRAISPNVCGTDVVDVASSGSTPASANVVHLPNGSESTMRSHGANVDVISRETNLKATTGSTRLPCFLCETTGKEIGMVNFAEKGGLGTNEWYPLCIDCTTWRYEEADARRWKDNMATSSTSGVAKTPVESSSIGCNPNADYLI